MAVGRSGRGSVVAGVLVTLGGLGACILADPPADLPPPTPIQPIEILEDSVQPSSRLLTTLPGQFVVPILFDPREQGQVFWQLFVDQSPSTARQAPEGTDGGVSIPVDDPPTIFEDSGECHTFLVLVYYAGANEGDSVTWYYSPTGTFEGCPVLDAGPEGGSD
jgi:hypothetical protein